MTYEIILGDVLETLRGMPDGSASACLTDVPYGLGDREPTVEELIAYLASGSSLDTGGDFLGNDWEVPSVAVWKELVRVLKPGGYVLSFAGSRTQDLITLGMRAGGLQIKDTLMWLHAEGAPKPFSPTDKLIDKHLGAERPESAPDEPVTPEAETWEGHAHALAPAFEPIVLGRKPMDGTIAESVLKHGAGALNVGECRLSAAGNVTFDRAANGRDREDWRMGGAIAGSRRSSGVGRWPKNVLLEHSGPIVWMAMRDDITQETADAILTYYGVDEAVRSLRPTNSWDAVGTGRAKVLQQGLRWTESQGSAQDGMGFHCLRDVREAVRSDSGVGQERPTSILLKELPNKGSARRKKARSQTHRGLARKDAGRCDGEVSAGELVAVEGRPVHGLAGLCARNDRDAAIPGARDGVTDAPEGRLYPRAQSGGGDKSGAPGPPGRSGSPREWGETGQPIGEPDRTAAKRSFDQTPRTGEGIVCPTGGGVDLARGKCRLEVDAHFIPARWRSHFVVVSHEGGCRPAGTREIRGSHSGVPHAGHSAGGVAFGSQKPYIGVTHVQKNGLETVASWICVDKCPVKMLDDQSGERPSTLTGRADPSTKHANRGDNGGASAFGGGNSNVYADRGAASRFYFVSKASAGERDLGCEDIPPRKPGGSHNDGPAVKPIRITKWAATLLLVPTPDATILVMYCGTGSEVIGALRAGWPNVIGIERDPHWASICRARVARWEEARRNRPEFDEAEVIASASKVDVRQVGLFGQR